MVREHSSLRSALSIQGAHSVRVVAVETGATVWSQSSEVDGHDGGLPAAVADLLTAAARVVGHTDADAGLDDLVLSSLSWFHILRLTHDKQAVHLQLDRRVANLALARRELKAMVTLVSPPLPHRATAPPSVTLDLILDFDVPDWLSDEPFDADTPTLVRVLAGLRQI